MTIRPIEPGDRAEWCRLRAALWPGSVADHEAETRAYFEQVNRSLVVYVADVDRHLVGFLELDYRTSAPGCTSSPIPFIEGWYVEPQFQRRGIGAALMRAAEDRARAEGYTEIASDAELENAVGIAAHLALGYEETDRVVSFRRALPAIT